MVVKAPPPPLDEPSLQNPLECPPLRWGLISCGRVCHDFTQALKQLPTQNVVACSARDASKAKVFAQKHGIPRSYGSYEELLQDEEVQIVYLGNIQSFRRRDVELCIRANKHVLVEKPFACTLEDAEYLIELARERKLFVMEGMWTRFFPAVEFARRSMFGHGDHPGSIGEIVSVYSDFQFNASDSDPYPTSFFFNRKLGGGASNLVGPYPISAATLCFPQREPEHIKVVGQVDEPTGTDLQVSVVMSYAATGALSPAMDPNSTDESTPKLPGAGMAACCYGLLGESMEETTVVGTKGRLTILTPGHCPTAIRLQEKLPGRGQTVTHEYEFPLPEDTDEIIQSGGYFYPNSAGFAYEAAAVARCIYKGLVEAPQYTLRETLLEMKVLDQVRKQLGVKTIYDD